jgi:excisionase family DNA binding protein
MSIVEIIENYGRALTVDELAELTRVSTQTIYRHIKAKKLPAYHIGTLVRLDPKATAEWLRSRINQILYAI